MEMKTTEIAKNVRLHFLKTEKFKTNNLSIVYRLPLRRETVTKAALLPRVLKRGTIKYPTLAELSKRAEELYGATISASTAKRGDNQLLRFSVQSVSDSFITESITADIVGLLAEFVLNPKTVCGTFDKEYVAQEKENLKNFIKGLINDKKEYASEKGNSIMFEGDPYGIFVHGDASDLDEIDEKILYDFYQNFMNTAAIDIYVCGSFDETEMQKSIVNEFNPLLTDRVAQSSKSKLAVIEDGIKEKRVTEEMPTSQSKLYMGFNCGVDPTSDEYYAVMVFACMFGGSPFSKLFNNVREKLSLAYYVYAALDRQKSCMTVSAGIEANKFDEAQNEIMKQLRDMQEGNFTDDEIVSAKKYLLMAMSSKKDSMAAMEEFYINQSLLGICESVDKLTERLSTVNRQQIIKAASMVQRDTVYFLKGVGGNEA